MALGLVAGQHGAHLPVQRRADAAQPHGNVLVHGGLTAPERSRRCTHRGVVGGNVLPQLHGALFRIGFFLYKKVGDLPPAVKYFNEYLKKYPFSAQAVVAQRFLNEIKAEGKRK